MDAIAIKNLDVVFGDNVQPALDLLDKGLSRSEIIEQTGQVVGVDNVSLNVKEGEICVLMGLSGSGKSSLLRAVNGLNPISVVASKSVTVTKWSIWRTLIRKHCVTCVQIELLWCFKSSP